MSDEALDREWKPNGRPQSTMARSFSLALNDLFKIDNSIADLDAAVSEKKRVVSSQTSELEALEARLRATEERLKARQAAVHSHPQRSNSPRQRIPLGDTFSQPPHKAEGRSPTSPLATRFGNESRPWSGSGNVVEADNTKTPSRPSSGWARPRESSYSAPIPGALPPTPSASEDGDIPPPPPPKGEARDELKYEYEA